MGLTALLAVSGGILQQTSGRCAALRFDAGSREVDVTAVVGRRRRVPPILRLILMQLLPFRACEHAVPTTAS